MAYFPLMAMSLAGIASASASAYVASLPPFFAAKASASFFSRKGTTAGALGLLRLTE